MFKPFLGVSLVFSGLEGSDRFSRTIGIERALVPRNQLPIRFWGEAK